MHRGLHIGFLLAAVVSTGASTACLAQDDNAPRARIKTDDLDLRSAAGRATFDSRVSSAATSVCGNASSGPTDLVTASTERDCRAQVARSGNAQAAAIVARQDASERSARSDHAIPYRLLRRTGRRSAHHHHARRVVHHRHGQARRHHRTHRNVDTTPH